MPEKRSYAQRADTIKRAVGALEFHHPDLSQKDFAISAHGSTRSWDRARSEIQKCVLICANCHREVHAGVTQLPIEILVET